MTSRRNIVVFIRSLNLGGAEKQSIYVTAALSKVHKTFLVVLYGEGELIDFAISKSINMIFLKGSNLFKKSIEFYRFLRSEKIHVLINFLPVNNIIGLIIGFTAGIKLNIASIRGSMIKNNKIKMLFNKILCNSIANLVISNSFKAKESYSEFGIKKNKILVIPNAIEPQDKEIYRIEKEEIIILSVGRFTFEKDYFTAIDSIKKLLFSNNSFQKIHYNIVGYGQLKKSIQLYINSLNLSEYISIFEGYNLSSFYNSADIFLLTSIYEGMPNTIMEAMSFSLPVISTNVGDSNMLVISGFNGFICAPKDSTTIASHLKFLVNSYNKRIEFGISGYKHIKENYSLNKLESNYLSLIDNYKVQ